MSRSEKNAYILGTDADELFRLGLQHQVWSSEAQRGWSAAGFKRGDILLDLGCGPGYCSQELAFITGEEGKVIAVDKSESYIDFVKSLSDSHGLNIEALPVDFDSMRLADNSLDGMYCRWALAWLSNPKEVLQKVMKAMRPGARMVIHEYYDWSTHQTTPQLPNLNKAIAAALKSFKESDGEIDIGRELPGIMAELGMKVISYRPMQKLVRPSDFEWQWPNTFYPNYFPKLADMGYLSHEESEQALLEMKQLEQDPGASLYCPSMVEIIAEKGE